MGHVATNILHCCTCPDGETKYSHPCGCPSVTTTFQSKQRTAVLCGFNEYSGGPNAVPPSVPPKRYLKKVWNLYEHRGPYNSDYLAGMSWCYTDDEECITETFPDEEPVEICDTVSARSVTGGVYIQRAGYVFRDETFMVEASVNESGSCAYPSTQWGSQNASNCNPGNPSDCAWQWQGDNADPSPPLLPVPDPEDARCVQYGYSHLNIGYNDPGEYLSNAECTETTTGGGPLQPVSNTVMEVTTVTKITCNRDPQILAQRYGISSGFGNRTTIHFSEWERQEITLSQTLTLSQPDSDEDALERAPESTGTTNSSVWQLRTTDYSFLKRESSYTIKASDLKAGIQYRGCVVIERRRAFSGAVPEGTPEEDLDWHDVEPDIIEPFTADPDENGATTIAEDVDLPHVEGWEYRVKRVGSSGPYLANVWPTYAECECPSEWEPEE